MERAIVDFDTPGTLAGNTLTVSANARCQITLVPDRAAVPPPPAGPGVDAAEAQLDRPDQAELVFQAAVLTELRAGAAKTKLFGADVNLSRTNAAPTYDADAQRVWIPFKAEAAALTEVTSKSKLVSFSGLFNADAAGWCPALSTATPDRLGGAPSGGMFALISTGDLRASLSQLQHGPLHLGRSYFLLDDPFAGVLAPTAEERAAFYPLSLWHASTMRLETQDPFSFLFLSSSLGHELATLTGLMNAVLDTPRQADGSRIVLSFPRASLSLSATATGMSASVAGARDVHGRTALALSNGLLTVTPAQRLNLTVSLDEGGAALSGNLELMFGLYQLLPALPDPYAANFNPLFRADAARGRLLLHIAWDGIGEPSISTEIVSGWLADGVPNILPQPQPGLIGDPERYTIEGLYEQFVHRRDLPQVPEMLKRLRLIDVSTNADQLGIDVGYLMGAQSAVRIEGVDVVSLGGSIDVLMLPQTQWEPVQIKQNTDVGALPPYLASPDDGGPALVGARTVQLVPIAPRPYVRAVVDAHNDHGERFGALFTLPFGIRAVATLEPEETPIRDRSRVELFRKSFVQSMESATQVRLTAAAARLDIPLNPLLPSLVRRPPIMNGAALQMKVWADANHYPILYFTPGPFGIPDLVIPKPPPFGILEPIDEDFNTTFGPGGKGVPIERIDLSGFGASCFSNWWDDAVQVGITNVRFELLTGRTRYEVVKMRSILYPCHAVVVRTITLERRSGGNVYRWDTGWQPVTDGLFESTDASVRFNTGAVRGFYNIRHIRDTPGVITLDGGVAAVEAVYFDTEIEFDHVVKGAVTGNRVSSPNQLGFVQRIPLKIDATLHASLDVHPLNPKQLQELLNKYDPVGGTVDCVLDIAGSGQQMRLSGVYFSPSPRTPAPGDCEFTAGSYGTLLVPRNEQWSVAKVVGGDAVSPADSARGVPLIRSGGTPHRPPAGNYRIADPLDLLNPNPANDYGLMLTTPTNRVLFRRPEVSEGVSQITGALPPVLADPYALVGCGGVFPPIQRCVQLTTTKYMLDIVGGVFRWNAPKNPPFTIPDLGGAKQRFLVKSETFDLVADYTKSPIELATNQDAPWSMNLPQVPVFLDLKTPISAKQLLTISNDLFTPGISGTPLKPPKIEFGDALRAAKEVITALQNALGGDLPPIEINLSAPTVGDPGLRLDISANFPIAQPDGSAIDIGIGKFRGLIGVGTEVQLALTGFGGRIYFRVSGELQQALLPDLLYVGGGLNLEVSIDQSGKPAVRLVTSAVASIGGDLIPDIIAVEGSASYGYFLDTNVDPFVPGVQVGVEVRAKLVSGLVGVRFRADASLGVMVDPGGPLLKRDLIFQGQIHAMGSVVAAWALEEDFSKTLSFEQKVPAVAAAAFAVYTGIVPLPV
jgi:hypothetical protein